MKQQHGVQGCQYKMKVRTSVTWQVEIGSVSLNSELSVDSGLGLVDYLLTLYEF